MANAILEEPSYKILLSQLKNSTPNTTQKTYKSWKVNIKQSRDIETERRFLTVSNVWIQGLVSELNDDSFLINDNTGVAKIVGLLKLPTQSSRIIRPGNVVTVIGHVLLACNDSTGTLLCAQIKAMKVTNIAESQTFVDKKQWINEVYDAQGYILNYKETFES